MKLYDENNQFRKMSYSEALSYAEQGYYITRKEWDGFHFINPHTNEYTIVLKNGDVLTGEEPWNTDSNDWVVVKIKLETVRLLIDKGVLSI